jgi:hypothetical protein
VDTLKFEVSKVELIEEISNSQLTKVRMWIVSEGNNKHNLPILKEAIQLSKYSLVGKPVLCKYNEKTESFEGHEPDEIPVGVFLREDEIYEEEVNGKFWLVADAYIWKVYFPHIVEVFRQDDENTSKISMEIQIVESEIIEEKETIKAFVFLGVTLIGVTPAIDNAKATVLKFSEIVKEVEDILNFDKKEDEVMVFNKEEFATTVGMTMNQLFELIYNTCSNCDGDSIKYSPRDFCNKYVYAYDYEKGKTVAVPYVFEKGEIKLNTEEVKNCRMTYVIEDDGDAEDSFMSFTSKLESEKKSSQKETYEKQISEFTEKISTLETEKTEMSSKIEGLESENSELKVFKANVEASEKDSKIDFAIQSVIEDLTSEQVDEWKEKAKEFDNIAEFENSLRAFAYSVVKSKTNKKDEYNNIHIPKSNLNDNVEKSLWDRL